MSGTVDQDRGEDTELTDQRLDGYRELMEERLEGESYREEAVSLYRVNRYADRIEDRLDSEERRDLARFIGLEAEEEDDYLEALNWDSFVETFDYMPHEPEDSPLVISTVSGETIFKVMDEIDKEPADPETVDEENLNREGLKRKIGESLDYLNRVIDDGKMAQHLNPKQKSDRKVPYTKINTDDQSGEKHLWSGEKHLEDLVEALERVRE